MPNKYQVITEMEAEHLRTLTVNTDHYMDFLTTAANNFKYSFQEQLLIFAQKPDATACAEVSWWNKHGRWVNRNTKGIALLVDTDAPYKLRHVFDVSDTNSRVSIKFSDGKTYEIDQVLGRKRAAASKVGGTGIRYSIRIGQHRTFLFEDEGLWFVEAKNLHV